MKSSACSAGISGPTFEDRRWSCPQPVECPWFPWRITRPMAANRTPIPLRLFRLARLALHLVRGLAIAWLRYPKLSEAGKQAQKRRWSNTLIAVCPEGVTTFGRSLERFHSALFQPALDAAATLQPVALRYLDAAGRHTDAAGYVGDTSLFESVWTIVSTRHMVAEFNLLAPISVHSQTRRSLAEKTESAIARALGVPGPQEISRARHPSRKGPGTSADPPGEPH